MRTVRDVDGERYLLVKRSSDSSLVRDPATGESRHLPNEELTVVEGETPLETAASGVPRPVRRVLSAVHDDRSLGLLVDVVDRGPLAVREMVEAYDYCESDLLGACTEFRAAGLLEPTTVAGERGYEATEAAREGVQRLRE
jgi:hypothetical protein